MPPALIKHATERQLRSPLTARFPLFQQHHELLSRVLDYTVHLDIVLVIAEWILELHADALDAVERKGHDGDNGDGPPPVVINDGKGEDAAEEGEDLFLVDATNIKLGITSHRSR